MGQQEYDAFRERIKQWMLDNADIYDEFEEVMNSQCDVGVQQIMAQAMALASKEKFIRVGGHSVRICIDHER